MKSRNYVVKIAFNTLRRYRLLAVTLLCAIIGTIIVGIIPPLILERIVNRLADNKNIPMSIILMYMAFLAVSGILDAIKESLITIYGQRVTHGIRSSMCSKIVRLPVAYLTDNEAGVIASRFVGDVDTVENLFTAGIISMGVDVCRVISILVIIWVKSKGLSLLLIAIIPIIFYMTVCIQKKMLKAQTDNRRAVGKVNNHVPETINNIRMIHNIHCEEYMENVYDGYITDSYEAVEKSNYYDAIYSPIIITISSLIIAFMMIMASRGSGTAEFFGMTVGASVAVINYVSHVFEPLESIGMEIQNIQSAIAGMSRINEFLGEREREIKGQSVRRNKMYPAISFEDVCFGYTDNEQIIKNRSFKVMDGEHVTLTGRTGAGKSTIFRLILGYYRPQRGNVCIYGIPAADIDDTVRGQLIGYVEQSFRIIPGTVIEQITLKDRLVTKEMAKQALLLVGLKDTVEALENGYDTPCTASTFSQGQLQLLSIARAIRLSPVILLLDEITANLDSETEKAVMDALERASRDRTVISISHRLSGRETHCINVTE